MSIYTQYIHLYMKTRTYTQKKSNKSSLFYKIIVTSANSTYKIDVANHILKLPFIPLSHYNLL